MDVHICLTGGGTLGPVTPLLAVVERSRALQKPYRFTWIGTEKGIERVLVDAYDIPYTGITSAKLPRYFSKEIFLVPFRLWRGYQQALACFKADRPDVVVSLGAYSSVPAAYAAWRLGIPVVVHVTDIRTGLAIHLMKPVTTLATSIWPRGWTRPIGALVRPRILQGQPHQVREKYNIPEDRPIVLVTGGGTGAVGLNRLVVATLPYLREHAYVIHITGMGKKESEEQQNYTPVEFIGPEIADYLAAATVVVTRAGTGALAELAALSKPTIIVPIPHTQQLDNARFIAEHGAGIHVDQSSTTPQSLADTVLGLLREPSRATTLGRALHELIPNGTDDFFQVLDEVTA